MPNGEGELLASTAFDVRWSEPVDDPFQILAAVAGDSPLVSSGLGILHGHAAQRSASVGVEGLLLGSVYLRPHGPGCRATSRRRRSGPALPPCRRGWVGQDDRGWHADLAVPNVETCCQSGGAGSGSPSDPVGRGTRRSVSARQLGFTKAWVKVLAHEDPATWPQEHVDVLVVDEAHHVTRTGRLDAPERPRVAELARHAESVLLLSATPVRSNEAGFLDLLHLLDPDQYDPDDLDSFVRRVDMREQLALTCQALVPKMDAFDLSLYADELRSTFPHDVSLAVLLDATTEANDSDRAQRVRRLREYLSETYRLPHRLIRTGAILAPRGRFRFGDMNGHNPTPSRLTTRATCCGPTSSTTSPVTLLPNSRSAISPTMKRSPLSAMSLHAADRSPTAWWRCCLTSRASLDRQGLRSTRHLDSSGLDSLDRDDPPPPRSRPRRTC